MKRLIGFPAAVYCLMFASTVLAGSGYDAIPETDYMKQKIGTSIYEQNGQTSLDAFYRWKQKSLEKESTPSVETPSGESGEKPTVLEKKEPAEIKTPAHRTSVLPEASDMIAPGVSWPRAVIPSDSIDATDVIESADQPQVASDYILGSGDVVEISVWKDEALSRVVPILPDGMIQFPLIGQLLAAGKTTLELQQEIEERISKYVPNPFVDVSVQQVNSMLIYIVGKVHNPGRFVINANISVLQALAMAGGLNTFAKGEKIKIIRERGDGQQILNFNYEDAAMGRDLSQNIRLERGDIIIVN